MSDGFTYPERPWDRKNVDRENRPADAGRYDPKFYKKKRWLKVREWKLWDNPYCEISEAYGRLVDGQHVDHVVPRSIGGSDTDPRNLMTLSEKLHGKKSGLERVHGCLVEYMITENGLVPVRKDEIVEVIGKMVWGRMPDNELDF